MHRDAGDVTRRTPELSRDHSQISRADPPDDFIFARPKIQGVWAIPWAGVLVAVIWSLMSSAQSVADTLIPVATPALARPVSLADVVASLIGRTVLAEEALAEALVETGAVDVVDAGTVIGSSLNGGESPAPSSPSSEAPAVAPMIAMTRATTISTTTAAIRDRRSLRGRVRSGRSR